MSEDVFARIQKAAKTLNKKADEATEYIRGVEERLSQIGVGVEVVVDSRIDTSLYTKSNDGTEYLVEDAVYLGYGRIGNKWGLILRTETSNNPNDPEASEVEEVYDAPLLSAERAMRVKAVRMIPALLKLIENELTELTGKTEGKSAE